MRHYLTLTYVAIIALFRQLLMISDPTMKLLFVKGFSRLRVFNAKAKAYKEFIHAQKNVPAYRDFLINAGFLAPSFTGLSPNIDEIPFVDKVNYVKTYPLAQRCINGKIPDYGVVIDESSGSSGTATNWVRGAKERRTNARFIKLDMQHEFGLAPLFIINAFALGPWATGVNITMSCVPFSKLKSLGPDSVKIEHTLKDFGNTHRYIITGYPPFLKSLVDHAEIDWHQYDVSFVFGGESMSEGLRDYLMNKGIKKIFSSFGASDLELNIAAENKFTIELRRLLRSHEGLRKRIVKYAGALPMVFQYNCADFLIETSNNGELIITICRPDYLAPKIRYNIHDRGHVLTLRELYAILDELNIKHQKLPIAQTDFPILLHYGRADMSVSFFGATVTPTDIQEVLFHFTELAEQTHSFCIAAPENDEGLKKLVVALEMQAGKSSTFLQDSVISVGFFEQLAKVNQDFREARRMCTAAHQLEIKCYDFAQGPFKDNDVRIKARYINP